MPTLVRTLHDQGAEIVVFHCALSQQRGPAAARGFVRERERLFPRAGGLENGEGRAGGKGGGLVEGGESGHRGNGEGAEGGKAGKEGGQEVCVLEGGFVKWQEK